MFKILYATGNKNSSLIQLARFIEETKDRPYQIKIASYIKSSPKNINIDWTLDSLLNIYDPEHFTLEGDDFKIYYDNIKRYAPDLIISDLEYFTSYIANQLNITLWQCSSSMVRNAISFKYDLGFFKKYAYLLNKRSANTQRNINIIDNSDCNYVYSYLGDLDNAPELKQNFKWTRPYHVVGKINIPCQHNVIGATLNNNKKLINLIKNNKDSVVFSNFYDETYANVKLKDIGNNIEFACNLKNSNLFLCEGQTGFLADAYYNNKYSAIIPDFTDAECVINSVFSEKYELGTVIYDVAQSLELLMNKEIKSSYNKNINYLHEEIDKLVL